MEFCVNNYMSGQGIFFTMFPDVKIILAGIHRERYKNRIGTWDIGHGTVGLPVAALTGVFGESMLSRPIDLGRPRRCFVPAAGRDLMTVSMSSISFSCFLLRYSCLMNSFLALSSSFRIRSSSAFNLVKQCKDKARKRFNTAYSVLI